MKKNTLLLMLFLVAIFANAAVIVDETFDYAATNLTGVASWTHAGIIRSTGGAGRTIQSGGFEYKNAGGTYILSGVGNTIKSDLVTNSTKAEENYISYKALPNAPINSGDIYLSFLYQANGPQTGATDIIGLAATATNPTLRACVSKQSDGTTNPFLLGVHNSTSSVPNGIFAPTLFEADHLYLIVIKYSFVTQQAYLFVDPLIASASEPTPNAVTAVRAITSINNLMFFSTGTGAASRFFISGVRVSTTWGEAVQSQVISDPLATPAVGAASDITADGFTANWTPVANAVSYDVEVYLGANLYKTINAAGQSASSLVISDLMSGIAYTYKVIAKGDIINYANSARSAASASFATLADPYATSAIYTDFGDGTWGEERSAYESFSVNGFDIEQAKFTVWAPTCSKGEVHSHRFIINSVASGGKISFPMVNSVEQIEIHAAAGSAGGGFQLKEFNPSTNTWDAIGGMRVYEQASMDAKTDSVYTISISRAVPTYFRIENAAGGSLVIYQIITRKTTALHNISTSKLTVSGKTITASEVGIFDIYNLQGAKVYHVKNLSTVNTNLATGLYILQYTDLQGRKLTQKITIN